MTCGSVSVSTTFGGIPFINDLQNALAQRNPNSYYPTRGGDWVNALLRFGVFGPSTPTVWNKVKGNLAAFKEAHPGLQDPWQT